MSHRATNFDGYNISFGQPEGKRTLGKPRRIWEDNISMDVREIGWEDMEWMQLAQYRNQ
jgi:hypothetical protein